MSPPPIDDFLPFEDDHEDDLGDFPGLWAEDDNDDDWLYRETAADFEIFGNPSPNSSPFELGWTTMCNRRQSDLSITPSSL